MGMKKWNWLKIKLWSCTFFCLAVIVFLCAHPFKLSGSVAEGYYGVFSHPINAHFKAAQAFVILLIVLYFIALLILGLWVYGVMFHKEKEGKDGKKVIKILNFELKDADIKQFGFAVLAVFLSTITLISVHFNKTSENHIKMTILSPWYYAILGAGVLLFVILMVGTKFKKENSISDLENYLNSKDE